MHYSLMGKMRLPFIESDLLLEVPFKAGLTVDSFLSNNSLYFLFFSDDNV